MDGVLNEATNTIHKRETGSTDFQTECGVAYHVSHDNLRIVTTIEPATDATSATKCGRCFDDAGGY